MFKAGFVAVIGRPNVGKSTLVNKVIGQKVVITTPKPQTTRRKIKGIYTDENVQIIFLDTPGITKPIDKLGEFLLDESVCTIPESDVILFVVDVTEPAGNGDKWIAKNLLQTKTPIIIVCNKSDMIKNQIKREENILSYKLLFKDNLPTVKISAKTGRNIDTLIKNIEKKLPTGDIIYPEDEVTDESMRDIVKEIIREQILLNTKDELPHAVAVVIESYEEKENIDRILATVYVETESQKGIMIGKNAGMLKQISTQSRIAIEEIVQKKVYLNIQIKVQKKWRQNKNIVKNWIGS